MDILAVATIGLACYHFCPAAIMPFQLPAHMHGEESLAELVYLTNQIALH